MSLRHWLRTLSRLMREYFSSCAILSLNICSRSASLAWRTSSSASRSISSRSSRSWSVSLDLPFLPDPATLEPPFIAFLILAIAAGLAANSGVGRLWRVLWRRPPCSVRNDLPFRGVLLLR